MARTWDVAAFGAVAVDTIHHVDAPLSAGKGRIVATEVQYGGNAATALVAAARLGVRTAFLGYLPGGGLWEHVRVNLTGHGVDISEAELVDAPPIRSTILVDPAGERFIAFDDDTLVGPAQHTPTEVVAACRVLLMDSYGAERSLRVLEAAHAAGVQTVGDLERVGEVGLTDLLETVGHLVIPQHFAAEVTGLGDPLKAAEALWNSRRVAVVITDGAQGAWIHDGRGRTPTHVPAVPVRVVDTTGAGDVFHGAYCAAVAEGRPLVQCVERAALAAAISTTATGGRGHLPTAAELDASAPDFSPRSAARRS